MNNFCEECQPKKCKDASCLIGYSLRNLEQNCGDQPCRLISPNEIGNNCHDPYCPTGQEVRLVLKNNRLRS